MKIKSILYRASYSNNDEKYATEHNLFTSKQICELIEIWQMAMYVMCHTNKHFLVKCFVDKWVIVYAVVYGDAYTVKDTGEIRNPYTTGR